MRYTNKQKLLNDNELYKSFFDKRGVKEIIQYGTAKLKHPTATQVASLQIVRVIWKRGDAYWKLAAKYYHDPSLWWVIGWYNQKPTDAHVEFGDLIDVPLPIDKVVQYMGV